MEADIEKSLLVRCSAQHPWEAGEVKEERRMRAPFESPAPLGERLTARPGSVLEGRGIGSASPRERASPRTGVSEWASSGISSSHRVPPLSSNGCGRARTPVARSFAAGGSLGEHSSGKRQTSRLKKPAFGRKSRRTWPGQTMATRKAQARNRELTGWHSRVSKLLSAVHLAAWSRCAARHESDRHDGKSKTLPFPGLR